jgi:hypothetical protein
MGDIANPGRDVMADMDQMAKRAMIVISDLPVVIFFITNIFIYVFATITTDKHDFCYFPQKNTSTFLIPCLIL